MKTNRTTTKLLVLIALAVVNLQPAISFAQGTTGFTYQGQLRDNGTNANGNYTMVFALYDASTDGDQIGGTITTSPTLANGLFTANLDFGPGAFNGAARWLDITVSTGGTTQELSPRVQIMPAPYAQFATVAATVTNGAIRNAELAANAVNTTNIQTGAITTIQIAVGAVSNVDLSINAVTDTNIVSVSGSKVSGVVAAAASLSNGNWNVNVGSAPGPAGYTFNNALVFSANGAPCLGVSDLAVWSPNGLGATEVDCGEMNVRDNSWNTVFNIDSNGNTTTRGDINTTGSLYMKSGSINTHNDDGDLGVSLDSSGNISATGNLSVIGNGTVGWPNGGNIYASGFGQFDGSLYVGIGLSVWREHYCQRRRPN